MSGLPFWPCRFILFNLSWSEAVRPIQSFQNDPTRHFRQAPAIGFCRLFCPNQLHHSGAGPTCSGRAGQQGLALVSVDFLHKVIVLTGTSFTMTGLALSFEGARGGAATPEGRSTALRPVSVSFVWELTVGLAILGLAVTQPEIHHPMTADQVL